MEFCSCNISMKKLSPSRKYLFLLLVLAEISLACVFFASLPSPDMNTGPAREENHTAPLEPVETVAAVCLPSLVTNTSEDSLVSGVILLLAGGLKEGCIERSLFLLNAHFLVRYSYPVHIFHEGIPQKTQSLLRGVLPSAGRVVFEDVKYIWEKLPNGVSERELKQWMSTRSQRSHAKRGYRIMCRFWAGLVWNLPSLDSYEYYWRLDTDSFLTVPVPCDVFRLMQVKHCAYGYRHIQIDRKEVIIHLWPTFLRWAKTMLTAAEIDVVARFALNGSVAEYKGISYFNNFELGSMKLKHHPLYNSMFRFIDEEEPRGIMRYRWGDAPIHTFGVEMVMAREKWKKCKFQEHFAGYAHGSSFCSKRRHI